MNRALFLDRDGVVNIEKNYLYKTEDFEFIDGVFETCREFQERGYLIFIVTNQAGIARGIYTEKDFNELTKWMLDKFVSKRVVVSKVYYCPHHPDFTGDCACRKPEPGMLLRASQDYDIDLSSSIFVGDKKSDMVAAKKSGILNRILVRSGHEITKEDELESSIVVNSIAEIKQIDI